MAKNKTLFIDVERNVIDDDGELTTEILSADQQRKLVLQVEDEWNLAYPYNETKRKVSLARLKLYNNQRRNDDAVGDPLLFTVFNTVHASLYDDRLMVNWEGKEDGDDDVESNLNVLSEHDYDVMQKNKIDYEWNWDAEFFGRGLKLMMEFDRTKGVQAPVQEIIDVMTWVRDPRAKSVNGDMKGRGGMRFGGRVIGLTQWELENNKAYFNIDLLKKSTDLNSTLDEARDARKTAQGLEVFKNKEEALGIGDNYEFQLLEWFTTIKGQKYIVTSGNNRGLVVRFQKIGTNKDNWPILDRTLYPMSHDWDGVNIPDLVEDKQRMKAVLLNLGLKSAKADVMPTYMFDQTRIKNKKDLNFRTNKFVPVDGKVDGAIAPIQKATVHQYVDNIMNILDASAQRATATPDIKQGAITKQDRTLGELELASEGSDTRFAMSAKIYGWSEADEWRQWYKLYKKHFKEDIDEKVVRIQGANAPIWRPLKRDNIIANIDPDVKIESRVISEAKRLRDQRNFTGFATVALQDPENGRRFIFKKLGKLNGLNKEELEMAFPPTVDELQADEENLLLNEEKTPIISIRDDHNIHIHIHGKANQNAQSIAHIRQHKKLMIQKRNRPDLFSPPGAPQLNVPGQAVETPTGANKGEALTTIAQ